MIFEFELKPIEEIYPWGESPNLSLSWFGFTDGKYRLKIGDEYLLNYSKEYTEYCIEKFPEYSFDTTFIEYQVVRLWEDVLDFFPDILRDSSKKRHFLDAGYLTNSPHIWICADEENVIINWDNRKIKVENIPVWSATFGNYKISKKDFIKEVKEFDEMLIKQMNERVKTICQIWSKPEIKVDCEQLKNEQNNRATWLDSRLKNINKRN